MSQRNFTVPITAIAPPPLQFDPNVWANFEQQYEAMREGRINERFDTLDALIKEARGIEREIEKLIGNAAKSHERLIMMAARKAGDKGVPLSDLRRFIPDPNHLTKARESLLEPKDDRGDNLPPVIREERGENNELRIFLAQAEVPQAV